MQADRTDAAIRVVNEVLGGERYAHAADPQGRLIVANAELMVLESMWREPLGAISPESLAAEGYGSLAEYRRYWMARERRRFAPTRMITVYDVRPWRGDEDVERFARLLLERLYGAFT